MFESSSLLEAWKRGRNVLKAFVYPKLNPEVLQNRVHPDSNSVGFLLRHIVESEYFFATTFLNNTETVEKKNNVPGAKEDTLEELLALLDQSAAMFEKAILSTEDWETKVESRMGVLSKREAVGLDAGHIAYHAGQISLAIKYGKKW